MRVRRSPIWVMSKGAKLTLNDELPGASFHIGARTRVRLADEPPGVLLHVTTGRLRATFDKLVGDGERDRLVTTPSAVLAVRGTEYGVVVTADGASEVVVFSGVVEVFDASRSFAPVAVGAGQACRVLGGQAPSAPVSHGMSCATFDRGGHTGGMDGRSWGNSGPGSSSTHGGTGWSR